MDNNQSNAAPLRTAAQARKEFLVRGLSVAEWARAHGYSAQLVYQILRDRKPCVRGQSHRIAVQLGLKRGLTGGMDDIDAALVGGPHASAERDSPRRDVALTQSEEVPP